MKNRVVITEQILEELGVDALLFTSASNIFYLTGYQFPSSERDAYCLVLSKPRLNKGKKNFVFTDSRYIGNMRSDDRLEIINSGGRMSVFKTLSDIVRHNRVEKLGFEKDNILHQEYLDLRKNLKNVKLVSINQPLRTTRLIKSDEEIKHIKKACSISDKAFKYVLDFIKKGITENELACKLETFIRQSGAELAFPSIVAFGKNSAIPHHTSTNYKLYDNNFVLLDFGAKINGYCADITRTVYFGKPSKKITDIYETVKNAQIKALKILNSDSIRASDTDLAARQHILSKNYPNIPHSVGHGVGIDVHEAPNISPYNKEVLKSGMVVTIEPGIYISNLGGVRIEDTVYITENNIKILTHSTKDFIVI